MKKIIIGLFLVMVTFVFINKKESILIPNNAIRFRVIANTNDIEDQVIKMQIKNEVEQEIYKLIKNVKTIDEARKIIKNDLKNIDKIVDKYGVNYSISYGNNFFPEKEYKGINYKAGNYESLVITLGGGNGKNWWCVLFPPLCLLDEEKNLDDTRYELYAKKIINNFK